MLPQGKTLTAEQRSLAGLTLIDLSIHGVPAPLVLAEFTANKIEEAWGNRLEAEGYTLAEGDDVPMLELRIYLIKNPQVEGAVVLYPMLKLHQDVEVARIGQEAVMATYTQFAVAIEPNEEMGDSFQAAVDYLIAKFLKDTAQATHVVFPEDE